MPPPINPTGGSSYSQEFNEWRDAFPGSVPVDKGTIQDGVLVDQQAQAYACGTDPEIDAAVCTNGVANPDAGIIEVDLHESAAEVARRTGQTNAPTFQEYTRQWN